jgi:hypothetical protein
VRSSLCPRLPDRPTGKIEKISHMLLVLKVPNARYLPAITQAPRPMSSPQPTAPIFHPRLHGPGPVPVDVGGGSESVVVMPGDIAVLDEAERAVVVVPKGKLVEFSRCLT